MLMIFFYNKKESGEGIYKIITSHESGISNHRIRKPSHGNEEALDQHRKCQ